MKEQGKNGLKTIIRSILKEFYDSPGMSQWSDEDIKTAASSGDFKPFELSATQKEEPLNYDLENLHKQIIKNCPIFNKMNYNFEHKRGYDELMFTFFIDNNSNDHSKQSYGITISIKYYTKENEAISRKKGGISYSSYFFIENLTDKTKSPERFFNPDMEYNEEDPMDHPEDFSYNDEDFLEQLNSNKTIAKANSVDEFIKDHEDIICSKINKFDAYVKTTYDFDIFK